jgi:hypothetical protein
MINSLTIVTTLLSLTIVTNFSTQPLLKEQRLTIEKLTFCHLPFQVITIQLRTGMIHPKNEKLGGLTLQTASYLSLEWVKHMTNLGW